ncbi:hypothetical protein P8452_28616 [Trifolium repens]|nr:hypothetical protein P8452_28616 [Trifolium repens]
MSSTKSTFSLFLICRALVTDLLLLECQRGKLFVGSGGGRQIPSSWVLAGKSCTTFSAQYCKDTRLFGVDVQVISHGLEADMIEWWPSLTRDNRNF